jgi:protein tyrosine phosphatase (PTP) superfamily phosphohydrolase (DUF442 family)
MVRLKLISAGIGMLAGLSVLGCRPNEQSTPATALPVVTTQPATAPTTAASSPIGPELKVADLHNVHALTPRLLCGSGPETDEEFKALAARGIKTVISVDGSKPNADIAEKYGLRYVHLPVGYDGISRERELEIGRAVRDLPGPFYIHCHHGQHRGPTGAVVAAMTTEGWTADQAIAALHVFGTSPHYAGLYATARDFRKPTAAELDGADASFPRIAPTTDYIDTMVEVEKHWAHIKAAQKAGWQTPADQPDLDPPHEALMLKELLRELQRPTGASATRPADLVERLGAAEQSAGHLEDALRAKDLAAADRGFNVMDESCTSCHSRYRDDSKNVAFQH